MSDVQMLLPTGSASPALPAYADLRDRATRTMAIFGAGLGGQIAFGALAREARVVAFVDNAEAKWGTLVCGVPVVSPQQLRTSWPDVVVVASQAVQPITEQLQTLGLARHRIQVFTPSADDLAQAQFQTLIDDLQAEITTLLGLAPETGAPLRLVIFGAGAGGRDAWARCRGRHRIVGFADNDPHKIGTVLFGVPVMAPSTLTSTAFDRVVVGSMYFDQICQQLVSLGVPRDRICAVDELARTLAAPSGSVA